jgi:putative ABC transport system permease protein
MRAFLDNLLLALQTLRGNPLRSLLTLLGIVIGASTVVGMMSLVEGFRLKMNDDLAGLGAASFQVQKWPAVSFGHVDRAKYAKRKDLTREQGEALRQLPHVKAVSIEAYHQGKTERVWTPERATKPNVTVAGGVPDYQYANALTVADGRFFTDVDVALGRRVVFLYADVASILFPGESAVGKEVRIRQAPFTVVGVAEPHGAVLGQSQDAVAVIPLAAFDQVLGKTTNHNIAIAATSAEDQSRAQDEVIATLRRLRGLRGLEENDFEIYSNESVQSGFNQLAAVVGAATFAVTALALVVGGIGIMNIMLVSVAERTREIGVRKALGARRRRILSQFVIEAVTLSLLGGVLGVLLGAGGAILAREVWTIPTSIPAWAVLLSLLSASGAGLVFGIYPAFRASRLDPVEAMRTE